MLQSPHRSGGIGAHLRSNVIGYVALFFALTMGTAYATHPGGANTISTDDIIDSEVRSADINNGAVNTEDITNDGVRSEDVRDDTSVGGGLAAADLGPASVGSSELGPNAVGSGAIADGALLSQDLADGAVTNTKLGSFSVSTAKIQSDAITESKYAFGSVDQNAMQTDGVASAEIVNRSVRADEIGSDAVGARALRPLITRSVNVTLFAGASLPNGGTANCNSDEVVIGGGADWTPALHHTYLIEEGRNGNGWRVLGYYGDCPLCSEDPPSVNLEIEAYCLPL